MKFKACASASGGVIFVPETLSRKNKVTKPLTKTITSKGKGAGRSNDNKTDSASAH
ncbi:MAG TPA: hypothetical protein PLO23_07500 [Alphaproteobacteria bacterium]|nr:hypothetical protein [Alphaproteobacteria bacterium]